MSDVRHFLDLDQIEAEDLRQILELGAACKQGDGDRAPLVGKTLAMIFEKPSTRTRVSFEVGIKQLGGSSVVLSQTEMQIGRGETIGDTARVLSRYVDGVMMRTDLHEKIEDLAEHATIPIINGLTDRSHPCQLMADIMTYEEHRGDIKDAVIAWCGDGNNMAITWLHAAARFGFEVRLACPAELAPPKEEIAWARKHGATIIETDDPRSAVAGSTCVVTDTWVSMGDQPGDGRQRMLEPYRVDEGLMDLAPEAIFMHCLPAHRGEEVSAGVLDGPQSVVWDEAENRLHAQKGVLLWCMG
ncbi:MAG: ornithine carbamoyltransferase [Rhodospirillaceae bacterium]|jgi:ornithine carbamoyltransferase|nr:ornithine carbamoyltransferase [Rhodospirillaceae bacterium]MBT5050231.1 ornithine carbamoyltransferase [Rhodospirillaceae bacterium]MBT5455210.1 ornithine carbamoyltransferase [Rhodospirillaceae bacterium]